MLDSKENIDNNPDLDDVASEIDRAMSSLINHKEPYVLSNNNNHTPVEIKDPKTMKVNIKT